MPAASADEGRGGGLVGEQPVAETADGQVRNRREGRGVMAVDDQPGDLVVLVRDDDLVEKGRERHVGERQLRRHPLGGGVGGDPGQPVARARG